MRSFILSVSKFLPIAIGLLIGHGTTNAQSVSINSTGNPPDAESILDISSNSKGVLLPRVADHTTISPTYGSDDGLMVYDTTTDSYWYWDATTNAWKEIPNMTSIPTVSLDDAYDNGIFITADAGAVQITGTTGAISIDVDKGIQLAEDQWMGLGSTIERIEFDGSLNRIDIENADLTMDDGAWIGVDGSSPRIEFEDASGRLNMQDADIELDDGAWIGINASNPRIEFDGTNNELNILDASLGVGTTAPDDQSLADFRSSTKGMLFPRMTTVERDAIGQGTNTDYGLWVYNEDTDAYNYWDGNSWEIVASTASIDHNTLDESYDEGGSGAGRTITADNGAVNISGSDGLTVSGNVGIGTLNPYTKVRVDAQTNGFNVPLVVSNSASNTNGDVVAIGLVNEQVDYGHFFKAAIAHERTTGFGVGKLHFLVDDASDANSVSLAESRITILPNGNVGIGTTSPGQDLDVNGDARLRSGTLNVWSLDGTEGGQLNLADGGTNADGQSNAWSIDVYNSDLRVMDDGVIKMYLKNNGNIGINNSDPSGKLHVVTANSDGNVTSWGNGQLVVGQADASGASSGGISLSYSTTNNAGYISALSPTTSWRDLGIRAANTIFYSTGTTESMRITSGGRVGVGNTNPQAVLHVSGSGTSGTFAYGYLNSSGTTGTCGSCSVAYTIQADGRIRATEFNAISDQRIKMVTDRTPTAKLLKTINELKVTRYKYIDEVANGQQEKEGFIAQEVEEVVPSAIKTSSDFIPSIYANAASFTYDHSTKMLLVNLDKPHGLEKGNEVKLITDFGEKTAFVSLINDNYSFTVSNWSEEVSQLFVYGKKVNDFRAVDYDQLFSIGIGAIQELSKENQQLKDQVQFLTAELQNLNTLKAEIENIKNVLHLDAQSSVTE